MAKSSASVNSGSTRPWAVSASSAAAPDAVAVDGEVAAEGDEWQSSGLDLEFVPETPRGAKRVGVAQEGVANVWTEKKISRLDLRCEDLEDWLKQNGRQDMYKLKII